MRRGMLAVGHVVLVVVVMTAATLGTAGEADAAVVLCQRKGKIRLRDGSCTPKEQLVQLDGASVDAASLDQVPSAAAADSATSAGAAASAATAASATTADSATTAATAADAGLLDGLDSAAFQRRVRWAHVSNAGVILAQSGGISVVTEPIAGIVVLDFGEDLRGKAVVATVRNGLTNRGWAQVSVCGFGNGGGPETTLCNVGGDVADVTNELAVAMIDENGTGVDRNFHVVVLP